MKHYLTLQFLNYFGGKNCISEVLLINNPRFLAQGNIAGQWGKHCKRFLLKRKKIQEKTELDANPTL